jgi:acylphosphatase
MIVAFRLVVTGRVQGVGFRAFVTWRAGARGLRGWVRNRRDGSVEALLIGEGDAVAAVIEECGRGPLSARVDRVEKTPALDDASPDFAERPTV